MAVQARAQAADVQATGTLVATPCVVHAIHFVATGTGGSIVLRDDGAGGTTVITIDTPAAAGSGFLPIPANGLEFGTDCHATLADVDGVTIIYTDI